MTIEQSKNIIKVTNGTTKHLMLRHICYLEEIDTDDTHWDLNIVMMTTSITLSFSTKDLRKRTMDNIALHIV